MSASETDRIAVAGAGLAGLTAAYRLQKSGFSVHLFEKKPHPGGRVYSFSDDRTGDAVDNGQHVYLGCCSALRSLLSDVGCPVDQQLQDQLRLVMRSPDHEQYVLQENSWLPGPINLLPLLLNASFLSWTERYRIATCFWTIYGMEEEQRTSLDQRDMASWLRDQNQSDHAIASFWNVFIISTLNAPAEQVSAASAIFVFKEGLLSSKDAGRIGVADRGQTPFYIEPLVNAFEEEGGILSCRTGVQKPMFDNSRCSGVKLDDGTTVNASAVVLSLPPWALSDMEGNEPFRKQVQQPVTSFETAPILCVNVWLEQQLVDVPFLALLDSPFDWIFNRNQIEQRSSDLPQHLSFVKSAAFDELSHSVDDLTAAAKASLDRFYPDFSSESVEHVRITKEPRATFIPEPGLADQRPSQDPPPDGLYLAGAWTDTGWPSTMESAVRSGDAAASHIRDKFGDVQT